MPRNEGIRVNAKDSNVLSTSAHETSFFSWATIARLLNALPWGICECENPEDAKGYAKVLIVLLAVFLIAGIGEGGAI